MEVENIENNEGGRIYGQPGSKDELPNSIIVTQVPEEVFSDPASRSNFSQLFNDIEADAHFDFLRSFKRVRVVFSTPENAVAAKLIVQQFSFQGTQLKAFLAQRVILNSATSHLSPPPLEKQFLISPPCSPPVGWEQTEEMAPVVCNFDLMARLASFAVDEKYELHSGGSTPSGCCTPSIVVHPCETMLDAPSSIEMPRTPRPEADAAAV